MTQQEMLALADRVESLQGPEREVNKALVPLVGLRLVEEGHPLGSCCYDVNGHGVPLPNFTSSLDAAMGLVPEGWQIELKQYKNGQWYGACTYNIDRHYIFADDCESAAIALTAAALRARAGHDIGESP